MEALNSLPESQKQQFMLWMENHQMKMSLKLYNDVVAQCFDKCTTSFKSKKLDDTESKCVTNCAEKFMRLTQRAGFRVAEHQQGTASP